MRLTHDTEVGISYLKLRGGSILKTRPLLIFSHRILVDIGVKNEVIGVEYIHSSFWVFWKRLAINLILKLRITYRNAHRIIRTSIFSQNTQ